MTVESSGWARSAALAGMSVRPGEYLRAFIERHYRLETLRVQVAELEKKMSREKQLDKKYELAKERQLRDKELLLCL